MATEADPIVGQWYFLAEKGEAYQVTAFDEDLGSITLETVDGEEENLDLDTWFTMDIQTIADPEGTEEEEEVAFDEEEFEEEFEEDEGDDDWGNEYDE